MYAAKDDSAAAAFSEGRSLMGLQEVPLGQRAASSTGRDQAPTARYALGYLLLRLQVISRVSILPARLWGLACPAVWYQSTTSKSAVTI